MCDFIRAAAHGKFCRIILNAFFVVAYVEGFPVSVDQTAMPHLAQSPFFLFFALDLSP